jgi:Domain of unknown function (DUF4262)
MCWLCDHPGRTWLDYLGHIRELIDCHGWAVQGVGRDRARPPLAYTVGLAESGRPELVVTGLPLPRAAELLNDVASHVLHAEAPQPGERVPLIGGPVIEIVQVAVPNAHLMVAVELYGSGIQALQLVHADDRGQWPWEAGFRGMRGGQPVLGVRAHRKGAVRD